MWNNYRTLPDIGWIKSDVELQEGDTVFVNDSELGYHVWITVDRLIKADSTLPVSKFIKGEFVGFENLKRTINIAHITVHEGQATPAGEITKANVFID